MAHFYTLKGDWGGIYQSDSEIPPEKFISTHLSKFENLEDSLYTMKEAVNEEEETFSCMNNLESFNLDVIKALTNILEEEGVSGTSIVIG